jgi:ATP-dependent helicase/nuclease subunit A
MEKSPIEVIVQNRLAFMEEHGDLAKYKLWGDEVDPIHKLTDLRAEVQEMSATEIMNLLLEKLDIRRVAAAWGNTQQRFDNIDALRAMALQYEENCNRLHNAATLGGFLLWLDELSRDNRDQQGSGADSNAINVLTYHKSKGLEWPVVICYDMANNLRENVFDVRIISENEEIDLKDPLAGRLLCFWVNPYSDLVSNTALMMAIDIHPDRQKIKQAALDEEARLLYVGLTRARDYLILPVIPQHRSNNYGTDWLNRVFHHGQKEIPSIDPLSPVCLWSWEGYEIPVVTTVFDFDKEIEGLAEQAAEQIEYLEEYSGEKAHSSEHPESPEDLFGQLKVSTKPSLNYCKPLLLPEDAEVDIPDLTKLLHLFLRSDRPSYSLSLRESSANHLLQQFRMSDWLDSIGLVNISNRFHKQLKSLFVDFELRNGVLFKYRQDNRFFKGTLDYLLTCPNGERILIADVPLAYEEFKKRTKKKEEFAAFLHAASLALQSQTPMGGGFQYWLHFPLEGKLLALSLSDKHLT